MPAGRLFVVLAGWGTGTCRRGTVRRRAAGTPAAARGFPWKRLTFLPWWLLAAFVLLSSPGAGWAEEDATAPGYRVVIAAVPSEFLPYYLRDKAGRPAGFAIDVMNRVAARAGLDVTYRVFEGWKEVVEAIQRGEADLIPNMGITEERRKDFDFTIPVETLPISIFVRSGTSDIDGLDSLAGHTVAAVETNAGVSFLKGRPGIDLRVLPDVDEALIDLLSGQVDALVYPQTVLNRVIRESDLENRVKIVGAPILEIKRAIAVRKGNTALVKRLDKAVHALLGSQEYPALHEQWFGKPRPFWTASRSAWAMSGLVAVVAVLLVGWRFVSVNRLNAHLRLQIEEREQAIVQRDRYQYEMVASEAKFRDLIEGSLQGVVIHRHHKPLFVNGAYARMHGYETPEEVLALDSIFVFYAPHEHPRIGAYREARMRGEPAPVVYEYEGRTRQGGTIWVLSHNRRIDWDGEPAIQITVFDITERKRFETSLREREQRLSSIYETTGDIIYHLAVEPGGKYRFISVNPAFIRTTGLASEQVIGKRVDDIIPEPSLNLVLENYAEAIREKKIVRWEETSDYPTGRLTGDVSIAPVFDAAGHCTHLVGGVHDITERKRAFEELARSLANIRALEQHARLLLDSLPHALLILDEEGRIADINHRTSDLFGYTREELIGRAVELLMPEHLVKDYSGILDDFLQNPRAGHPGVAGETLAARRDGSEFPVDVSLSPFRTERGLQVICAIEDVTDRRHLEAQIAASQKLETIGRLAGGIAHDFNNMLAVILSYANFLLEAIPEGDARRDDVQQILSAANRSAALTKQLLAFSRRQVLKLEDVDLNGVVAGTEKMLRRLIGEDILLTTRLAPQLGLTRADAGQLEQVLLNLAVNSRDAMPMGGSLFIETGNVELDEEYANGHIAVTPGPYVLLSVTDSGVGMDEATQANIFEPFFTTKEQGRGTGLGLSTVYGIVKQLGGSIWVYSEIEHGTTFKIYLPRTEKGEPASGAASPPAADTQGTGTILLVEDEELVRAAARRILESGGYTVLEADRGSAAIDVAQGHAGSIDLVLTDVVMPGIGGVEVAKRLHALRPEVRILYMTGYTEGTIADHGILKEDIQVLFKPFSKASLLEGVRKALAGS
jgi:PAS domain S-box-containing protein